MCGLSNLAVGQQLRLRILPWLLFVLIHTLCIDSFTLRVSLLESNHSATLANSELRI